MPSSKVIGVLLTVGHYELSFVMMINLLFIHRDPEL